MTELQIQSQALPVSAPTTDWIGSEEVIPAVKEKFYSYASRFSTERPLFFMMDCKANKARPTTTSAADIADQLDAVFVFGEDVIICSPDSAPSAEMLQGTITNHQTLNHTEIRLADISEEAFYGCHSRMDISSLVDVFYDSQNQGSALPLSEGTVFAVRTNSNKYGLIRVKSLTASACEIDACHVLL